MRLLLLDSNDLALIKEQEDKIIRSAVFGSMEVYWALPSGVSVLSYSHASQALRDLFSQGLKTGKFNLPPLGLDRSSSLPFGLSTYPFS
jgi:hypothetical protein